jgi:hypothetical protein
MTDPARLFVDDDADRFFLGEPYPTVRGIPVRPGGAGWCGACRSWSLDGDVVAGDGPVACPRCNASIEVDDR